MQHAYEPFVIRRMAERRVFNVNAKMPFEFVLDCFQAEQPFMLVSQLDDGRIAITPNIHAIPQAAWQPGLHSHDLLPTECEYVTMAGTYPMIMTAHPVTKTDEWMSKLEKRVRHTSKQTLADVVSSSIERIPVPMETQPNLAQRARIAEGRTRTTESMGAQI